jgi:hypothetical protein
MPSSMDEAVQLAVTAENAEQQWPSARKVFMAALADVECFKCHKKG